MPLRQDKYHKNMKIRHNLTALTVMAQATCHMMSTLPRPWECGF